MITLSAGDPKHDRKPFITIEFDRAVLDAAAFGDKETRRDIARAAEGAAMDLVIFWAQYRKTEYAKPHLVKRIFDAMRFGRG